MTGSADNVDKPKRGGGPRGRPPKPRYRTDEAAALGDFLKQLTAGLPVERVAELVRRSDGKRLYAKTKWSEFIYGPELIPSHVLEEAVRAFVPEPRRREVELKRGMELLGKAERAAAGKPSAYEMSLSERELRRGLEQAQQGQIRAQQAFIQMTYLALKLVQTAESLRRKCADLEIREEASKELLAGYTQRLRITEEDLAKARRNQEEAERLRLEAVQRDERYRLALEEKAPRSPADAPAAEVATPRPEEPFLEDYDAVLQHSAERLDETSHEFDELRRQLDLPPRDAENNSSPGQPKIVRGQLADNDKAQPTEPSTADDSSAGTSGAAGNEWFAGRTASGEPATASQQRDHLRQRSASIPSKEADPPDPTTWVHQSGKDVALTPAERGPGCGFLGATALVLVAALIAVGILDANLHDETKSIAVPGWVTAGEQATLDTVRIAEKDRPALTYSLASSTPVQISSTIILPPMKKHWMGGGLSLTGHLDFRVTSVECDQDTRINWWINDASGQFDPDHRVTISGLAITGTSITVTAQLGAIGQSGPPICTGDFRFTDPQISNSAGIPANKKPTTTTKK